MTRYRSECAGLELVTISRSQNLAAAKTKIVSWSWSWRASTLIISIFILSQLTLGTSASASATANALKSATRLENRVLTVVQSEAGKSNVVANRSSRPKTNIVLSPLADTVTQSDLTKYVEREKNVVELIQSSLNLSINPCDDFYEYACSNWMAGNPVPRDQIKWGPLEKLKESNKVLLRAILEKREKGKGEAEEKARRFYRTCMDQQRVREKVGAKPLQKLIEKIGGWSLISSGFDKDKWNFQKTLQILQNRYNTPSFFTVSIETDPKNSTRNIIEISYGGVTTAVYKLKQSYFQYLSADVDSHSVHVDTLVINYMTKIAKLLGASSGNGTRNLMKDIILVQDDVQLFSMVDAEPHSVITLSNLTEICPIIYWDVYLNAALESINGSVSDDDIIILGNPKGFKFLCNLIGKLMRIPEGILVLNNYLVWNLIDKMIPHLSKEFMSSTQDLMRAVNFPGTLEKWRVCVDSTSSSFSLALTSMYTREFFHQGHKLLASEMIQNIRRAFKNNLNSLKWMSNKTRSSAFEKMDALRSHVGFTELMLETNRTDLYYSAFDVVGGDHFGNILRANQFLNRKNVSIFDQLIQNELSMNLLEGQVMYYLAQNLIVVPIEILRPPVYDPSYPTSVNYGRLGSLVGQELIQGFYDQGTMWNQNGELGHWWDNETSRTFNTESQCLVSQYGKKMIWNQSLMGNIGGVGGIKMALDAYRLVESNGNLFIPKTSLTNDQLFFISTAQMECSNINSKYATAISLTNFRTPSAERVLKSLQNFPQFSTAFNCSRNSNMNPKRKCSIW